jgi:hypothetical protein
LHGNRWRLTRQRKHLIHSDPGADSGIAQRKRLSCYARLVPLELSTIELGGGSARCMIATIHLPARL